MLLWLLFQLMSGTLAGANTSDVAAPPPCTLHLENPAAAFNYPDLQVQAAHEWLSKILLQYSGFPDSVRNNRRFHAFLKDQNHPWESLTQNVAAQIEWVSRFIRTKWEDWNHVADSHRNSILALELRNLMPASNSNVITAMDGRAWLQDLSQANLRRMLAQLPQILPMNSMPPARYADAAQSMASEIRFIPAGKRVLQMSYGAKTPLVSDFTLEEIGIHQPVPSFDTNFNGQVSHSVPLEVLAMSVPAGEQAYLPYGRADVFIDRGLIYRFGFVTPRFYTTGEVIEFFRKWDPQALNSLFKSNRLDLPAHIHDIDELQIWENQTRTSFFTPSNSASTMRVLRLRMSQYVLTFEDTETFLRAAFHRWLLIQAGLGAGGSFDYYIRNSNMQAKAEELFRAKFLPSLGWMGGINLRVPISVPVDPSLKTTP